VGVTPKARSCRYMPPEKTYDWDEPRTMPYYMRGARSYFDIGMRNVTDEPTGSSDGGSAGILRPFKSLLSRLGLAS